MIKKILFITLSNIGDVILTLPALDALRQKYPQAVISVVTTSRPKEIFENNPAIDKVIILNKQASLREKIRFFNGLRKEKFDLVCDLRNSFFGFLLGLGAGAWPVKNVPSNIKHMRKRHLYKIINNQPQTFNRGSLHVTDSDKAYIENILKENSIKETDRIIIVSCGARSHIKRWGKEKFSELIRCLSAESGVKIILIGDKDDVSISDFVSRFAECSLLDLTGKTSLLQLACLLSKAALVICNDSAVLHLASYLDVRIVSIFGPTDELKYGPWAKNYSVVKKDIFCRPCQVAQCVYGNLKCMNLIKVEDALRAVKKLFTTMHDVRSTNDGNFKRILIVRTDRIGDVLLSTPVIKVLRDNYPDAFIAMMVAPNAKDVVDGNPYLDEVIVYDKDGKHKSVSRSFRFSQNLRRNKFDLALILHPINRAHLITFLAGIPRRIGYNRKLGFLLTDKLEHTKQAGAKHELEYNLDFVRYLGIKPADKNIFMPIKPESEIWAEELFNQNSISAADKLLIVHPTASCVSKIWPRELFAQVSDKLIEKYGFKALFVAGRSAKDIKICQAVAEKMQHKTINLAGMTSVSQLASLFKRAALLVSTDSGPAHIAAGVGTPVVAIFGRKQPGLSPLRWAPTGVKSRVLHKDAGCLECLAHNCVKRFACLNMITVDEVVAAADTLLKR